VYSKINTEEKTLCDEDKTFLLGVFSKVPSLLLSLALNISYKA